MKYASCRVIARTILTAVIVLSVGCEKKVNLASSDNPDDISPPATAGTVEQLQGTSWLFSGLDMVATFSGPTAGAAPAAVEGAEAVAPPMSVTLSNPKNPAESTAAYWRLRPNGVISISFMGNTKAGTWDGTRLILSGEEGTPAKG